MRRKCINGLVRSGEFIYLILNFCYRYRNYFIFRETDKLERERVVVNYGDDLDITSNNNNNNKGDKENIKMEVDADISHLVISINNEETEEDTAMDIDMGNEETSMHRGNILYTINEEEEEEEEEEDVENNVNFLPQTLGETDKVGEKKTD